MTERLPIADPDIQGDIIAAFAPADLADLLGAFLRSIDAEAAAIRAFEAADDPSGVEQAAHRLASAASQFGFPELAGVARAIERGRRPVAATNLNEALDRARKAAATLTSGRGSAPA